MSKDVGQVIFRENLLFCIQPLKCLLTSQCTTLLLFAETESTRRGFTTKYLNPRRGIRIRSRCSFHPFVLCISAETFVLRGRLEAGGVFIQDLCLTTRVFREWVWSNRLVCDARLLILLGSRRKRSRALPLSLKVTIIFLFRDRHEPALRDGSAEVVGLHPHLTREVVRQDDRELRAGDAAWHATLVAQLTKAD